MFLVIGGVMALAATLQSVVGFGFNLLAAPLLIFYLNDPTKVVPALHLSWLVVGLAICVRLRRQIRAKRVLLWFIPALPALILGIWLLGKYGQTHKLVLNRVIGTVTILATIAIALRISRPVKRETIWSIGAGGLSGLLCGTTGMSGPPVVLLGLNQGWPAERFRTDLLTYFTLLSIAAVLGCWWQGLITQTAIHYAIAGTPGLAIGFLAGAAAAQYIRGNRLRYAAMVLICIAGVLPWFG